MADKFTKHPIDKMKQFFEREIASVNKNFNKKFDELTQRLQEMDRKVFQTIKQAKANKTR